MDFFFYGTLMDPDVLAAVIGRRMLPGRMKPATLAGFRRVGLKGTPYPAIVPGAAAETVAGVVVAELAAADVRNLKRFEGAAYGIETMSVSLDDGGSKSASVFVPMKGMATTDREWDFEAWRRRHKRRDLGAEP